MSLEQCFIVTNGRWGCNCHHLLKKYGCITSSVEAGIVMFDLLFMDKLSVDSKSEVFVKC